MQALGRKNTFIMTYRQIGDSGPVYVSMKVSLMEDDANFIIVGITNVDAEMREAMAKSEALAEALAAAEHARSVLEEVGIRADICTSGEEALRMMEIQHTKKKPYNLVLMDWNMPGMNGLEASAAIRKLDREDARRIPIIALTANAFDEDVQRSLQAGMNAHLTKPVEAGHLNQVLGELVYEAEENETKD